MHIYTLLFLLELIDPFKQGNCLTSRAMNERDVVL